MTYNYITPKYDLFIYNSYTIPYLCYIQISYSQGNLRSNQRVIGSRSPLPWGPIRHLRCMAPTPTLLGVSRGESFSDNTSDDKEEKDDDWWMMMMMMMIIIIIINHYYRNHAQSSL